MFVNICVELLNHLMLMTANTTLECLFLFLSLSVLIRFDQFVYDTFKSDKEIKHLKDENILKIFTVETTTSNCARARIPKHIVKKDGICPEDAKSEYPEYIRINFCDRTCRNKFKYMLYMLIKCVYVSIWYYFIPLAALMFSYALAAYMINNHQDELDFDPIWTV